MPLHLKQTEKTRKWGSDRCNAPQLLCIWDFQTCLNHWNLFMHSDTFQRALKGLPSYKCGALGMSVIQSPPLDIPLPVCGSASPPEFCSWGIALLSPGLKILVTLVRHHFKYQDSISDLWELQQGKKGCQASAAAFRLVLGDWAAGADDASSISQWKLQHCLSCTTKWDCSWLEKSVLSQNPAEKARVEMQGVCGFHAQVAAATGTRGKG